MGSIRKLFILFCLAFFVAAGIAPPLSAILQSAASAEASAAKRATTENGREGAFLQASVNSGPAGPKTTPALKQRQRGKRDPLAVPPSTLSPKSALLRFAHVTRALPLRTSAVPPQPQMRHLRTVVLLN